MEDKDIYNSNPSGLSGFSSSAFLPAGSQLSSEDDVPLGKGGTERGSCKKNVGIKADKKGPGNQANKKRNSEGGSCKRCGPVFITSFIILVVIGIGSFLFVTFQLTGNPLSSPVRQPNNWTTDTFHSKVPLELTTNEAYEPRESTLSNIVALATTRQLPITESPGIPTEGSNSSAQAQSVLETAQETTPNKNNRSNVEASPNSTK